MAKAVFAVAAALLLSCSSVPPELLPPKDPGARIAWGSSLVEASCVLYDGADPYLVGVCKRLFPERVAPSVTGTEPGAATPADHENGGVGGYPVETTRKEVITGGGGG